MTGEPVYVDIKWILYKLTKEEDEIERRKTVRGEER